MKKDKTVTVRINGDVKDALPDLGLSVQKIVDKWVDENVVVTTQVKVQKVKKTKK